MKKFLTLTLFALLVGVNAQAKKLLVNVSNASDWTAYGAVTYLYTNGNISSAVETKEFTVNRDTKSYLVFDVGDANNVQVVRVNPENQSTSGIWNASWEIAIADKEYTVVAMKNDWSEGKCGYDYTGGISSLTLNVSFVMPWNDWNSDVKVYVWDNENKYVTAWPGDQATVVNSVARDNAKVYTLNTTKYFTDAEKPNLSSAKVKFTDKVGDVGHETYESSYSDGELYLGNSVGYSRTFASTNGSTVCLPFALNADEAAEYGKFYELKSADGDNVVFSSVEATEACVPYYFVPKADDVTISSAGKTIEFDLSKMDVTVGNGNVTFSGTLAATSKSGVYGFQGGNLVYAAQTVNIPEFRAYLTAAAGAKLSLSFEDETGINTISRGNTDNVYYDLQGRRVANPTKGLFIVNGKKVIK